MDRKIESINKAKFTSRMLVNYKFRLGNKEVQKAATACFAFLAYGRRKVGEPPKPYILPADSEVDSLSVSFTDNFSAGVGEVDPTVSWGYYAKLLAEDVHSLGFNFTHRVFKNTLHLFFDINVASGLEIFTVGNFFRMLQEHPRTALEYFNLRETTTHDPFICFLLAHLGIRSRVTLSAHSLIDGARVKYFKYKSGEEFVKYLHTKCHPWNKHSKYRPQDKDVTDLLVERWGHCGMNKNRLAWKDKEKIINSLLSKEGFKNQCVVETKQELTW